MEKHEWSKDSWRAFVFPHRVIVKEGSPVAQQFVPDESGQSFWEDLEAPASVCAEVLRLAERVAHLERYLSQPALEAMESEIRGARERERKLREALGAACDVIERQAERLYGYIPEAVRVEQEAARALVKEE